MIKSIVSSVTRLSLAPAKLTVSLAGSLLHELRSDETVDAPQASSRSAAARESSKPRPARSSKPRPKRARRRKPPGDAAIARKVESAIFRGADIDKGQVVVNVAGGVAQLRGEVGSAALIEQLGARADQVSEVRRVENLLHLPEEPAPGRTEQPASGFPEEPAGNGHGDRSNDPSPHHALNNPVGEPDPHGVARPLRTARGPPRPAGPRRATSPDRRDQHEPAAPVPGPRG